MTLEGRKSRGVAVVLGVHISTVRNWRGYFAHGGVAGLRRRPRPGQQAKIGPHAGAIAAAILNEDVRYDGGWTLGRLWAEIARRGGRAISPRWLSHQLRQRGLPSGARATRSKGARTQWRSRPAANGSSILKTQAAAGAIDLFPSGVGRPSVKRRDERRFDHRMRRGEGKCPQTRLWAQTSDGGTDRGRSL